MFAAVESRQGSVCTLQRDPFVLKGDESKVQNALYSTLSDHAVYKPDPNTRNYGVCITSTVSSFRRYTSLRR